MFPGLISLCCVMNEITQLFYQQFDGLSLESTGTWFLPAHLFHPKDFFLASTRGVYRSLRISSQFFSALHLRLGDILLSAFYSANLPASPVFCSCFVARCCSSQHSLAWSLERCETPMGPNGTELPSVILGTLRLSVLGRSRGKTSKEVGTSIKSPTGNCML